MKKMFLLLICAILAGGLAACSTVPKTVPITKAEATAVLVKVGQVFAPGDRNKIDCINNMGFLEAAWEQYKIDKSPNAGKTVKPPMGYENLLKLLVPQYLNPAPVCAVDGVYTVKFMKNTDSGTAGFTDYLASVSCSVHGNFDAYLATLDENATRPLADGNADKLTGLVTPEFKTNTDANIKKANDEFLKTNPGSGPSDSISAYEMLDGISQNVYDKEVMANIERTEVSGTSISFTTKFGINTGADTVNFKKVDGKWLIDSVSMSQTQLMDPNTATD